MAWIYLILFCTLLFSLFHRFVGHLYYVSGNGMSPSLYEGDMLFVNTFRYNLTTPSYDDIIVFKDSAGRKVMKRVIALPNDKMLTQKNRVYVNNMRVHHASSNANEESERVIPEGVISVSDNNNFSTMFVRYDDIIGRAEFLLYPVSRSAFLY